MSDTANASPAQFRDVNTITAEIRTIQATVRRTALEGCIEIGRRLVEVKELLGHGEWGAYLRDEFDWSQDRANQLMKLFREYGAGQQNLFGAELNSDTYRNLTFSQALRLIAIPESEREDFVKDNDVEHLSTRELDALIKEHEKALAAEKAKTDEALAESREAHAALDELADKYSALSAAAREQKEELDKAMKTGRAEGEKAAEEELSRLREAAAAAKKAAAESAKGAKAADKGRKDAEKALAAAKAEAEAARRDLKELKDNPEVPKEVMDKLRAQFAAAAEAAEKRAAELETRLKTADPTVAVFKVHFEAIQREFSTMLTLINSADAETGAKLRTAAAAVFEKFMKEVNANEA